MDNTYLTVNVLANWLATIIKTFFWNEISIGMPFFFPPSHFSLALETSQSLETHRTVPVMTALVKVAL